LFIAPRDNQEPIDFEIIDDGDLHEMTLDYAAPFQSQTTPQCDSKDPEPTTWALEVKVPFEYEECDYSSATNTADGMPICTMVHGWHWKTVDHPDPAEDTTWTMEEHDNSVTFGISMARFWDLQKKW
jgi:hypothetical protein